jgi:hypothetical protein
MNIDAYCQQCLELICKNCETVGHKHHAVLPIKTAFDNFRQATSMSKVDQDPSFHRHFDFNCVIILPVQTES